MTSDESSEALRLEFVQAIAEGRAFTTSEPMVIRGDDLRRLYLAWGTPWRGHAGQDQILGGEEAQVGSQDLAPPMRGGVISPAGIIIDGGKRASITIIGEPRLSHDAQGAGRAIDLSYLGGREGGPVPPLVLRNCRIDGELVLTGSHFAFLEIDGCMISRINADHCHIDQHCRLIDLKSATNGGRGLAQIRMVAARIDGALNLRGSRLRAPRPQLRDDPRQFADRYALSLASAEIGGRLHLTKGFTALGGVSLYQATVRHSVSLEGAKLRSHAFLSKGLRRSAELEESRRKGDLRKVALDAEEIRLTGSLLWLNESASKAPHDEDESDIAGQIVLRRAQIGGDCKFEYCRWAGTDPDADSTGGDKTDRVHGGIDARLARISGQLRLGAGCRVARWSAPPARRHAKEVGSGDHGASIDAWKAVIGKGVRIEDGATFNGPIFMNDTRIEHGFIMRGEVTTPHEVDDAPKVPEGLDLSEARISGRVLFESAISGSVTLRRARIDGDLELHKLVISTPRLVSTMETGDRETGLATILDLSSARIVEALHFGELQLLQPSSHATAQRPRPVIVDLRGMACRIFDDNEASAWAGLGDQNHWRLLLDGITFESFDQSNPRFRSKPGEKTEWRLRFPAPRPRRREVNDTGAGAPSNLVATRTDMLKAFAPPRSKGILAYFGENEGTAKLEEYSPQPYETFARAYFRDGKRKEGLTTAKDRATLRWCRSAYRWSIHYKSHFWRFLVPWLVVALIFSVLMNIDQKDTIVAWITTQFVGQPWSPSDEPWHSAFGIGVRWVLWVSAFLILLVCSPRLVLWTGWLFKAGFNYGFSPGRACVILLGFIFLGAAAANNVAIHPLSHLDRDGTSAGRPIRYAPTEKIAVEGCNLAGNNRVDRALYALDVFIPLVDLHSECAFFIAEKDKYLRLANSLYAILGWVIVSLTLLTFSGILRRDLEN